MTKKQTNRIHVKVTFSLTPENLDTTLELPKSLDLKTLFEHLNLTELAAKHGLVYPHDGRACIEVISKRPDRCSCENCKNFRKVLRKM